MAVTVAVRVRVLPAVTGPMAEVLDASVTLPCAPVGTLPVAASVTGPVSERVRAGASRWAVAGARTRAACRAVAAPGPGRGEGELLCRGHRPIIARPAGPSVHRARNGASVVAPLHTRELGAPG